MDFASNFTISSLSGMFKAFAFDVILDVVAFQSLNCLCFFVPSVFTFSAFRLKAGLPPPFFSALDETLALLCACECGFFMNLV